MWSLYGVVLVGAVSYGRPVGNQHAVHANTSTGIYLVSEQPFNDLPWQLALYLLSKILTSLWNLISLC